jgi:cell division transport system permease protein
MIGWLAPPPAERRILGGARLRSITPWIVAVMSFTILLVATCGLLTARAAGELKGSIGQRYVLTVPAGGGDVEVLARAMRAMPALRAVEPVSEAAMRDDLRRWLGPAADSNDLPVPALIQFDVRAGADIDAVRSALLKAAPGGAITSYGDSVAPLLGSLRLLQWVAVAIVLLLGAAAAAAVILAARGAIDSHRSTVDVLHGIGATDGQITRLFQHRIALDTLIGSLAGAAAGGFVVALVAGGSHWVANLGGLSLGPADILILVLLPLLLTAIATIAARAAILAALRESL